MTTQQALDLAIKHHQTGKLAEAERIYRQILAQQPDQPDVLHLLGVLAIQAEKNQAAVDLIRKAIKLYPNSSDYHNHLGLALIGVKDYENAKLALRESLRFEPEYAEAHNNLGMALHRSGEIQEAVEHYRKAIKFKPDLAEGHGNLGNALKDLGQLDAALQSQQQAIQLHPNFAKFHGNSGRTLAAMGQTDQAIESFRTAIRLDPNSADAHNELAMLLKDRGQFDSAIAEYRRAIQLNPNFYEAMNNLGVALHATRRFDESVAAFEQALRINSQYAAAHNNLGLVLKDQGRFEEAVASFENALRFDAKLPEVFGNLGNALKDQGRLEQAIATYRQGLAIRPDDALLGSNLLLSLHYLPNIEPRQLLEEHRRWNQLHAEPLKSSIQRLAKDRDPHRRLRIGYVSPNLHEHVIARFLLPLLANHERSQFEIFAYADVTIPDSTTTQLQELVENWRSIVGMNDAQVAEIIRKDRIDILIDLALHSAKGRLLAFAHKPAPVQATWLAYAGTSGTDAMDFRLTDPYLDPPGEHDDFYSERSIRLPRTYWCYQPREIQIDIAPLPAIEKGHVTFGCLNNFCKVSDAALAAWAKLLRQVPNSRLIVHAYQGPHRHRAEEAGIDSRRIEFTGHLPVREYLQLYNHIDIALDPFPFNGGTTTCDALWMGVPVVSLAGELAVHRAGLSLLSNVGLPQVVARSEHEYVNIATRLASDFPHLAELRASLRERMKRSPLMDAPQFARDMESGYREMWRR